MTLDSVLAHLSARAKILRENRDSVLDGMPRLPPGHDWGPDLHGELSLRTSRMLDADTRLREVERLIENLTKLAAYEAIGR